MPEPQERRQQTTSQQMARRPVQNQGPKPQPSPKAEEPTADEPKPKRRGFLLKALALMAVLSLGAYGAYSLKERFFPAVPTDPAELNKLLAQKNAEQEGKALLARQAERTALNKERLRAVIDRGEGLLL